MEVIIEQEIALHQFEVRQDKVEIERLIHPDFKDQVIATTSNQLFA
ncbi:hypothetical protein VME0621_03630 [Vibrio mediterranei]|nr:hypothetical protein VME0621_03630 [Vibrio mediterranei]